MQMYDEELPKALARIDARGLSRDDYSFDMHYCEPDPDGGGMFTVRYQIDILNKRTGQGMSTIGGIGCNWVADFDDALEDGSLV